MRSLFLVAGILSFFLGGQEPAGNDDVKVREPELIGGPSRLLPSRGVDMDLRTLEAYGDWSRSPAHFGAFAVSEYGDYGYSNEYNTIEAAEAAAMDYCEAPGCRVVARSVPLARVEDGQNVIFVSQRTAETFAAYMTRPGVKAMAIHPSGASGSWINDSSLPSAYVGALSECQRWHETTSQPEAMKSFTCRVVHATLR